MATTAYLQLKRFLAYLLMVVFLCNCIGAQDIDRNAHVFDTNRYVSFVSSDYAHTHCLHDRSTLFDSRVNSNPFSGKLLTVIMLYFSECAMLHFQIEMWALSKDATLRQMDFLVIDDHAALPALQCLTDYTTMSEDKANSLHAALQRLDLRVLRVDVRREWNIGGARNLGAFASCSLALLMCDIDALISVNTLSFALETLQQESSGVYGNNIYLFNRHLLEKTPTPVAPDEGDGNNTIGIQTRLFPHPGIMLLSRSIYWQANGCDEDFVGKQDPKHNWMLTDKLTVAML
jgi:hypothetical protein